MIYAKGRQGEVKIGFSVSKKIGNAVVRNKTIRRMREAVTPLIPCIKPGCRLIFIARQPIVDEKLPDIQHHYNNHTNSANGQLRQNHADLQLNVAPFQSHHL